MRIFVAGASGAVGRQLLPMLAGHDVTGMTRSRPEVVRELGAEPAVADVYDREAVTRALAAARPEVVADLLTDLSGRDFKANSRIRLEGTPILVDAAVAAGARRFILESVSFELPPDGQAAVDAMERAARDSGLEVVVLRFGLLWGPGTWYQQPEPGEADPGSAETGRDFIHVRAAAEQVREAIFAAFAAVAERQGAA